MLLGTRAENSIRGVPAHRIVKNVRDQDSSGDLVKNHGGQRMGGPRTRALLAVSVVHDSNGFKAIATAVWRKIARVVNGHSRVRGRVVITGSWDVTTN